MADTAVDSAERRDRTRATLGRMAEHDPELAARVILQGLPATAAGSVLSLDYDLAVEGVGAYRVSIDSGSATVEPLGEAGGNGNGRAAAFRLDLDPRTLAQLAAGGSPLTALAGRRLRLSGKRRKAFQLRKLRGDAGARELARLGLPIDPDLVFQALPYAIDPEWTRGHHFTIVYELETDEAGPGGRWAIRVDDGRVELLDPPPAEADATVMTSHGSWLALLSGELTPTDAMQRRLTDVDGRIHLVTLMGRWLDRAEGRDGAEQEREARQRNVQRAREGTWTGRVASNGAGGANGRPVDPAQGGRKAPLLTYHQLYALWERQNWRSQEIDFSVDKDHWATTPSDGQKHFSWTIGNFYVGEERVTADLAPFVLAAPNGEVEAFLATQLVDEARHAVFFDRFGAEVMALDSNDLRGRLEEISGATLQPAWREVFDDHLRGIANYLRDHPDDYDAFVDGIVIYHMVVEGFLAMTGQAMILRYMSDHDMYPGFQEGFGFVERDEHRHIAFGVRFLHDAIERDPKYRDRIERKILELAPTAALVFVPPYVDDPSSYVSYGFTSAEIYGYAYRALKRRMAVLGLEAPPPDEIMPGPIEEPQAVPA